MTRIGGGGPLIPPGAGKAAPLSEAQDAQKTDFATKVSEAAKQQGSDSVRQQEAKKTQQQSALTDRMRDIAKRLAKGGLDEKEATREFVASVIEERLPLLKRKKKNKEKGKDQQQERDEAEVMEEAISELIEEDPTLASRLRGVFKRLGTSAKESPGD